MLGCCGSVPTLGEQQPATEAGGLASVGQRPIAGFGHRGLVGPCPHKKVEGEVLLAILPTTLAGSRWLAGCVRSIQIE